MTKRTILFTRFIGRCLLLQLLMLTSIAASAQEAYSVLTESDSTLTFYYDELRSSRPGSSYSLNTGCQECPWFGKRHKVAQVVFDPSFAAARPTSTYCWFYEMDNLASISGIAYLNTSSVTYMRFMFSGCVSLVSLDLSSFNTANVIDMGAMFQHCISLKSLDVNGFNTSNVTDMRLMFADCFSLTSLDVSYFNTSNVTDMRAMFQACFTLTSLDVSGFNTSSVKDMAGMFADCSSLTSLDVSGFNTGNVTDMFYVFQNCSALTSLDLSNFNTSNVTDMTSMFNGCNHLETIYVGNGWSTDAVTKSDNMFYSCTNLVGGQGTVYDENHLGIDYAHIDGGPSNPGYLTGKMNIMNGDVNTDGEVNIADVNCIINVILGDLDIYGDRADVNADGEVTIADVNVVIACILTGC